MLMEEVVKLIGDIPYGFEPVVYIILILVLLYLTDCFYSVFKILLGHFLRRYLLIRSINCHILFLSCFPPF